MTTGLNKLNLKHHYNFFDGRGACHFTSMMKMKVKMTITMFEDENGDDNDNVWR